MAKNTLQNPGLITTILGGVDESVDVIDTEERFTRAGGVFPYFLGAHQKLFGKKLIDAYPGKSVYAFHQTFNGICQYGYYLQTNEKLYYHLCVSPSDHRIKFATLQSFGTNLENVTLDSLGQVGGISAGLGQLSKDTSHSCVFDFPDRPVRPIPPPGTDPAGPFPWPPIDDIDTTPDPVEPIEPPVDPDIPPGGNLISHFNGPFQSVLIEFEFDNPRCYLYEDGPIWCGAQHFYDGFTISVDPRQVTDRDSNFGPPFANSVPDDTGNFGNAASYATEWCSYHPCIVYRMRRGNYFVKVKKISMDLGVSEIRGVLYGIGHYRGDYITESGAPAGPFAARARALVKAGDVYTSVFVNDPATPGGGSPPAAQVGTYYQERYYEGGGQTVHTTPWYDLDLTYLGPEDSGNTCKGVQYVGFTANMVTNDFKFYTLPFNEDWNTDWTIP